MQQDLIVGHKVPQICRKWFMTSIVHNVHAESKSCCVYWWWHFSVMSVHKSIQFHKYLLALYNNNSLAYSVACFHTPNPFAIVYEPSSLALHNITSSAASFTAFVYSLLEIIPPNLNNLKIQCFFSGLPHRKAVSIAFPHFMDQRFGANPTAEVAFGCIHIVAKQTLRLIILCSTVNQDKT